MKQIYIILFSFLFSVLVQAQTINKGPYLTDISSSSIRILWESSIKTSYKVKYGVKKTLGQSAEGLLLSEESNHYLYEVYLTNLQPDIKYFYQIQGDNETSELSYFKLTADDEKIFTFAAMGDSRSHPGTFVKIMKQVDEYSPAFIISMGDLVENGGSAEQWQKYFFEPASDVLNHIPFISTLGDHEGGASHDLFAHFLCPYLPKDKLWYSFDAGSVHFVSLDYRYPDSQEMIEWFTNDMKQSKAEWKFVFMHRPCYNLGGHRSIWGRDVWPALFSRYKADFVLAGHSHEYERFYPVRMSDADWPVTYITTGGAGAGLYKIKKNIFTAQTKSVHHYIIFTVNQNKLIMRVYALNGALIDSLTVKKKNGIYTKSYLKLVKPQDKLNKVTLFLHQQAQYNENSR